MMLLLSFRPASKPVANVPAASWAVDPIPPGPLTCSSMPDRIALPVASPASAPRAVQIFSTSSMTPRTSSTTPDAMPTYMFFIATRRFCRSSIVMSDHGFKIIQWASRMSIAASTITCTLV